MRRCHCGFTLVELVTVLVILGILGSIGSRFIVVSIDSYRDARLKAHLLAQGRVSIEQMTRYLRSSVPNSIRVSPSGNCVEFMPSVGGGFYFASVADSFNGVLGSASVSNSPVVLDLGSASHALIGGLFATEIYTNSLPSSRVSIASTVGDPVTQVNFSSSHIFIRNSPTQRIYLADNPRRFCISGNNLLSFSNYGLSVSALNDANPGGDVESMASDVSALGTAFVLSAGSESRNTAINISLVFAQQSIQVGLNQTVLVRNVP